MQTSFKNPEPLRAAWRKARNKRKAKIQIWREQNRDKIRIYRANHRRRHKKEDNTRKAVERALKRGDMIRQPCAICGLLSTEAHHPDYDKPLDVIWLCRVHHAGLHRKMVDLDIGEVLERVGKPSEG